MSDPTQQPPVTPAQPAVPPPAQPTPPPAQPAAPAAPAAPPAASTASTAQQPVLPPPAAPVAPATPGGPVVPPAAYGAATPPPGGSHFKSGKTKTIALIVGGVVAVGVVGGIGALLAGGGGGDDEVGTSATAPAGSGVLDPAPVGSTTPATPSDEGEEEPSEPASSAPPESPTPEPVPEPAPPAPASGDAVTIGGNIAVPVPTGWQVLGNGDSDVAMSDGGANYVYAITGTVDPGADAGQLLLNQLDTVLPPDQYPDRRTSDATPQPVGGSVVSLSMLEYEGTWTDGQGTTPVHGAVFAAVRQDGVALVLLGEHTPPDDFAGIWPTELQPVLDSILLPFAGIG